MFGLIIICSVCNFFRSNLLSKAEKDFKMWHDFDIFFITIQSPADILAHQLIQAKEIGRASQVTSVF